MENKIQTVKKLNVNTVLTSENYQTKGIEINPNLKMIEYFFEDHLAFLC